MVTMPDNRKFAPQVPVDVPRSAFAAEYPFATQFCDVSDGAQPVWMHYVDEGPKDAPVVLMLHGNPTWSFLYRNMIKALSSDYRCIAVDHIGCGLSDRPQEYAYTLRTHADNLRRLIDKLGLTKFHLMMHDWGGMIGTTCAVDKPEQVLSMTVLNTAAFLGRLPKRIRTVRIPGFGVMAVRGYNAFVRGALKMCTVHEERLTDAVKQGFLAPYGNWHDRIATLKFVEDVPLNARHPTHQLVQATDDKLHTLNVPVLACWGLQDWCFKEKFLEGWVERYPNAEVHTFEDAGHFVLEDAHERIAPLVKRFLDGQRPADAKAANGADTQPVA